MARHGSLPADVGLRGALDGNTDLALSSLDDDQATGKKITVARLQLAEDPSRKSLADKTLYDEKFGDQ